MVTRPLLTIAIPTYNRAKSLESLLNCITRQIKNISDPIQIYISNNCSTDNTKEVIFNFIEKYSGLIEYSENEKNLGFDRNTFKVLSMATGKFVWLFGDDDLIVEGGIKKVIDFIKNDCNNKTGFIALGSKSYFNDTKNGKKVLYSHTIEEAKSWVYKIDLKDVMGQLFPASVFMSVMVYNNEFLKKIILEEKPIIDSAIEANEYIHTFLYRLMFLKYQNLEALRLNQPIIYEEAHLYKFYIEDVFQLHYVTWTKLCDVLLKSKYMNDCFRDVVLADKKRTIKAIIVEMAQMRCFDAFNYSSFAGCIKNFYKKAPMPEAFVFSIFFMFFSATPGFILKKLYKIFIKIRHKNNWQKVWLYVTIKNSQMSKGSRRLYD